MKIWDIGQRSCVSTLSEHADQVWGVAYSETGQQLVSGGDDKSLILYAQ